MSSDGTVTRWLGQVRAGDEAAAQRLWEHYFRRLVGLARTKLGGEPRRQPDAEDVALSAFDSFCRGTEQGRFPQLLDREGLWQLLVVITARKAAHLLRDEGRLKRGGGAASAELGDEVVNQILSREPTPDFAAQVADEYQRLLRRLGDAELEAVALAKMEGCTVEEIAARLGCALRSVKRKLALIRNIWEKEIAP